MTLRANNFSSGGTLVMFLVFIWRMKCFLSILVIEYPISPFLVSWGRFLSTSKSTPTQDYISKKSPPNLSSLLADCRAEVWTNHSHEAKNNYTGYFFDWHWQKTFQSSNSFRIQHQKLANLRIILIQSQNIPQNSCEKQLIVWIILSTTVGSNPSWDFLVIIFKQCVMSSILTRYFYSCEILGMEIGLALMMELDS